VDHLLLYCDVASTLWNTLFSRFGMSWVMPRWVLDLLACWLSSGRLRTAMVWKMAPTCLFWYLWRERKNWRFEDLEKTSEDILSSFYHTLYIWTTAYVSPLSFSFNDFLACFSKGTPYAFNEIDLLLIKKMISLGKESELCLACCAFVLNVEHLEWCVKE